MTLETLTNLMGASLVILPPKSQVKLSHVCTYTGASGAASWGWRGTTLPGNDVSSVLDVPARAGGSEKCQKCL